ncbi:MAG: slipin family protein [Cyanobacteriota bacterium]
MVEVETNLDSSIATRNYAKPFNEHVSLGGGIRFILFIIPFLLYILVAVLLGSLYPHMFAVLVPCGVVVFLFLSIVVKGIRIAAQWEKLVVLRLGRFNAIKGPGMVYIYPFVDYARFVDTRILTLDIPNQRVITKDNVPIEIIGVLFFQVVDVNKAIINIQDYRFAVSQYAQNSLRDVVGGLTLDEVLSEREKIQLDICTHIQEKVTEWGLSVDSVRIQDIEMPEDLKRVMSRQASAEREKRATIIKAEGDKLASLNLSEAAKIMCASPGAMQLRTLQTIDGLGTSSSNTVLLFPTELIELLKRFTDNKKPE